MLNTNTYNVYPFFLDIHITSSSNLSITYITSGLLCSYNTLENIRHIRQPQYITYLIILQFLLCQLHTHFSNSFAFLSILSSKRSRHKKYSFPVLKFFTFVKTLVQRRYDIFAVSCVIHYFTICCNTGLCKQSAGDGR